MPDNVGTTIIERNQPNYREKSNAINMKREQDRQIGSSNLPYLILAVLAFASFTSNVDAFTVARWSPNKYKALKMRTESSQEAQNDLPANLKRKVDAKRPTLGHVVPKNSRTRRFNEPSDKGGSNAAQLRAQGKGRDTKRYNNPSNLRILGGSHKGRKLESPDVYLRPMMGKVKEAVYSTLISFGLYDDEEGRECRTRHLDIFSGSGSVGLESLSRGAWHCTFVDMSNDCCGTCERNIEKCGFDDWNEGGLGSGIGEEGEPVAKVVCTDAFRALRQPETVGINPNCKYDIVTLCPPYEEIVYADLIHAVANSELIKEDTIILLEYPVELGCLPHAIKQENGGVLVGLRNRRYGRTVSFKVYIFSNLLLSLLYQSKLFDIFKST
jgi:16S rRNA (guanine966-N2)-methyltransferase